MDKKGITRRQFWIQMVPTFFYVALGVLWIVDGIQDRKTVHWALGTLFLVLAIVMIVSLIIQRKRHPIEDAELDKQVTRNFKDGMKGMGIFYGLIALAFLLAFGLVFLLS